MASNLWIDVEDLFEYARKNSRPSGIQRMAYEMYSVLQRQYGNTGYVRFIRHEPTRNSFRCVEWAELTALFQGLIGDSRRVNARLPSPIPSHSPTRQSIRKLVHRLPTELRAALIGALKAQQVAFCAWVGLAGAAARLSGQVALRPTGLFRAASESRWPEESARASFEMLAAPGDVLLVLGSSWSHPNYAALISRYRARGLRFVLLVYDLIPLRRPEWCEAGLVRLFRTWFTSILPVCDQVFAISRATAADVELYAREHGIVLPGPVLSLPVGSGFSSVAGPATTIKSNRLPEPGSYALIVSTIEVRKNHLLLFRVWRQLLHDLPRDRVPTLVCAGRIGWLVQDLMQQIANTNGLDGKLVIMEDVSDAELRALYTGCLFTLFPSLYEGWGLPVSESLSLGKPCFISNRTSLPEAGGTLARSFDPDDLSQAYAMIRSVLEDRADLARWEGTVKREFKPVPWSATTTALLAGLDHPLAGDVQKSSTQPAS